MPGLLRETRSKSKDKKILKIFALVFEGLMSAISENGKFFTWTSYIFELFPQLGGGNSFGFLGFQRTRWFILLNLLIYSLSTGWYVSRRALLEQRVF